MKCNKCILIFFFLFFFSIIFMNSSYADCKDLHILEVPQDVKDYLSSVSSEYKDKENYKFIIHRYGYSWACLGINVKDISNDLKFFYTNDNGKGDFVINQTGTSAIPVVRYTLDYGLTFFERRTLMNLLEQVIGLIQMIISIMVLLIFLVILIYIQIYLVLTFYIKVHKCQLIHI